MHRTNNILREDVRSFVDKIHGRSRDIINGDGSQQKITEFAIYDNTSFVISKFSYQILRTLLTNDRLVSIIFQARNKSRAWMESVFLPPSICILGICIRLCIISIRETTYSYSNSFFSFQGTAALVVFSPLPPNFFSTLKHNICARTD